MALLDKNITIFCREQTSYNYVSKFFKYKENLFLDHDMAFHIDLLKFNIDNGNLGILNAFRKDVEKTNINISNDNYDISHELMDIQNGFKKEKCNKITEEFLNIISNYNVINTNRTHVAVAGYLLGKKVNFYNNSYYKNKSIYEYSLKKNNKIIFNQK